MNENNPPMVLPNGYVYGENVSLDPFVIAFFFLVFNWLSAVWTQQSYERRGQEAKKKKKERNTLYSFTWHDLPLTTLLVFEIGQNGQKKIET